MSEEDERWRGAWKNFGQKAHVNRGRNTRGTDEQSTGQWIKNKSMRVAMVATWESQRRAGVTWVVLKQWVKKMPPGWLATWASLKQREKWAAVSAGEASSKDAGLSVRTGNKETDRKTGTVNEWRWLGRFNWGVGWWGGHSLCQRNSSKLIHLYSYRGCPENTSHFLGAVWYKNYIQCWLPTKNKHVLLSTDKCSACVIYLSWINNF
jgi:hypothetical protein